MPGRGRNQQSGSNSASSLCGGGRSVLVLCFFHIPSGRYRLVALPTPGDLFIRAKDLFAFATTARLLP
jgi:hypothetical protein